MSELQKPSTTVKSNKDEAARFLQREIVKLEARARGLEDTNRALIEEYVMATDEEAPEKIKKNMRALMPSALQVLAHYLDNGKESTAVGIAKYVIDRGLTPDMLGGIDAEAAKLTKLLEGIKE